MKVVSLAYRLKCGLNITFRSFQRVIRKLQLVLKNNEKKSKITHYIFRLFRLDGARMARRSDKNHSLILHVETSAQDNESHSQKNDHNISIESFNNTNNSTISLSTPLYSQSYKPVYTQKTVVGSSNSNMYTMQTASVATNNDMIDDPNRSTEIEMMVDEHVMDSTTTENDEAVDVSDVEIDERNMSFEYTDDDLNEVLLSSTPVLEPSTNDKNDTSTNPEENIITENHYMPMTPKKPSESATVPLDILSSIKKSGEATEENAYIEMIKGSENRNESKSTYEFINISNANSKKSKLQQLEPLYMELSHNSKRNSLLKNILDLPDILKEPIISNSTSSLNRILAVEKNIKRFSLSDTFRPASYYLSTVKETQNENGHKTIDEDIVAAVPKETAWERRQKNLSFDIKSSMDNKQLNTTQSLSQLSLPENFSKHYDKVKEHVRKTSLEQNNMVPFLEVPLSRSETANSSFDMSYIKPPDGFNNSSNEALDAIATHDELCRKLSNSHVDCYYDSLEDVNVNQSMRNFVETSVTNMMNNVETDPNESGSSTQGNMAACNFRLPSNLQAFSEEVTASAIADTAPYYYSDIAQSSKVNVVENAKLNNLKDVNIHRAGIPHIHNIIYNKIQENDVSIELKDANDKLSGINIKNLYEPENNKLQKNIDKETERMLFSKNSTKTKNQNRSEVNVSGDQLWEEDSLWCERLRVQSHRHTKSLDELNRIEEEQQIEKKPTDSKRQNSKLTRDVTYVNYDILPMKHKHMMMERKSNQHANDDETESYSDEADDVYVQLAVTEDLYETLREEETQKKLYSIDREKIRQWDLMSSGLHLASSFGNLQKTDYIENNENKNESQKSFTSQ